MRKAPRWLRWITMVGLLASLQASARSAVDTVAYRVHWINKTRVHVITVELTDRSLLVTPAIAWNTLGKRQSFISFLAQQQPLAQISGGYFSPAPGLPVGDVVIEGKIRYRGPVGSALAVKPDNTAEIINIPPGWKYSWPGYESVLQGGVRVVQNGKYAVYPKQQGFRDPRLFGKATRTAVGLTGRQQLLLMAVNKEILLSDLAGIAKALGCRDAMTLDGGLSTGLAYRDTVILTPGRTLATVLMVKQRPVEEEKGAETPPPAAPAADISGPSGPRPPALRIAEEWSSPTTSVVTDLLFAYSKSRVSRAHEELPWPADIADVLGPTPAFVSAESERTQWRHDRLRRRRE